MSLLRLAETLPAALPGTAIALPLVAKAALPPEWRPLAKASGFKREPGKATLAITGEGVRLLLDVGTDAATARAAGAAAVAALIDSGLGEAIDTLILDARALAPAAALALAEGAALRAWRFDRYRTRPDRAEAAPPGTILVLAEPAELGADWPALQARLAGVTFARDLVTEPANILTPAEFVARLAPLRAAGVAVRVLGPAALARAGCGALLAVGQGSVHAPCLTVLRWPGTGAAARLAPVAFIGKGLTFDTGGICIKPAAGMEAMRADMAGAAACAGAMLSLALRRAPHPAVAVLALAENATGAASYRPGDVLRSAAGRTIEVVDTDAEGRLALADALAFAAKTLRPCAMIDLATLTGAIVTALGHETAGLFANHDALAETIVEAGASVGEKVWRMPIGEAHRADLASDIADLRNCLSGRLLPDASHAAAFLREFAASLPWAHLDIAGVEAKETATEQHAAGATGFGVRLLDALMTRIAEAGL